MNRFFLAIMLIVFSLYSCDTEEDMQVRVQNNYSQALSVKIGPTSYGTVSSGETTNYKGVPEGSHQVSGDISGSITLTGTGKHNFTLTISNSGGITIKED